MKNAGIVEATDIPQDFPLKDGEVDLVRLLRENRDHMDAEPVREFLDSLEYPLYFMDFETFQPAVPLFELSQPYQQIPFQYSLFRRKTKNAELEHFEFLAPPGADPRQPFIETLLRDAGEQGTVLA